ncbi:hypothetical protein Mesil_3557 (plasmid) [Allomeiothermus silvanus DSM 9946]|uniref:HTH deoR-type domain-containing protein n=1 Tax=Allomeiothermus silvanus (strain ATCC 700542 / DSM 9946 / NBRC 106475 / NCIMB 13440 / VI-R2) TaxID=526227 RepID=D7BJJ4_ALLS1|nr:DeoR family transcriptional regulator [Allomeiothermus silvanus]ADH65350.1 hypothetical protein Mesil_3557 [Allomeiothermus silvanus DSM 9946]
MPKRQLTTIGLLVYATILVTSFLHVLEAFLAYSHPVTLGPLVIPGWVSGVGVALGLDLSILYFSYLSVILPGSGAATAKQASRAAMLLVWFAVLYSMVWGHVAAGRWLEAGVGLLLSLFVPLTSLRVGQLLAEISRMPVGEPEGIAVGDAAMPRLEALRATTLPQAAEGHVPEGTLAAAQLVKVETHIHTRPEDLPLRQQEPVRQGVSEIPRLNGSEQAVLRFLQQRGHAQVAELMQHLGVSLMQVGEVCATLEARGLIRRRDGGWEAT